MTTLTVLGRYRSSFGSYEPGDEITVTPEAAAFLMRDAPGSFRDGSTDAQGHADEAAGHAASGPEADADVPDADEAHEAAQALSAETATGLRVPDRRSRGGRRRTE